MYRRDFLRNAALVGAATVLGGGEVADVEARRLPGGSILDLPASEAPIDTIVVLMMENRSFDHYLGWLGSDEQYLEEGRSRWGNRFRVQASTDQTYRRPDGTLVDTFPILESGLSRPWQGCGFGDPGHGWDAGRAQRDGGFLAAHSGNDEFALSWYRAQDLEFYTKITRRFTIFDRYHCSLLGPTFPNREYLHSGQSGGFKDNSLPFNSGFPNGFPWATIWDRLMAAGVPAHYYYVDLPVVGLWGARLLPIASLAASYFEDAAAGRLANVVFLDPGFLPGDTESDEHPLADVRIGQDLASRYIKAFVDSPHWERGVFILTYDEWGGFFDHVRPPRVKDERGTASDDENDFGQCGFRVPTRMLSPFARQNFVDHRLYEHSSILRFIEWRFLGATPEGRGRGGNDPFLTTRDRRANNIGWSLMPDNPDPEADLSFTDPGSSPACPAEAAGAAARSAIVRPPHDLALGADWFADQGYPIGTWLPR